MSWTAHKTSEELEERFDEPKVLEQKVDELVKLIKKSKHFVAFTGAGISTSTGIPDFRGPNGVWTLAAQNKRPARSVSTLEAIPSIGHRTLKKLVDENIMKFVISTNCDGLHLRSGLDQSKLVEIHGNTNKERCDKCKSEYFRDESVRNHSNDVHGHGTVRMCAKCGGQLNDTIINFGENLYQKDVQAAYDNARKSDLMLVLGSSLRVSVWAVDEVAENPNARVVIINLQTTPFDDNALHIFARTDTGLQMLMQKLGLEIPPWRLHRRLKVSVSKTMGSDQLTLYAGGVDQLDNNYNFIPGMKIDFGTGKVLGFKNASNLPYKVPAPVAAFKDVALTLHFVGHYDETPLIVSVPVQRLISEKVDETTVYDLFWDVDSKSWTVRNEFMGKSENTTTKSSIPDLNKMNIGESKSNQKSTAQ